MQRKTFIDASDILDLETFEALRKQKLHDMIALKKKRRLQVGPHATFYFESFETIWWQIQEMLRIEKGGLAQIEDELNAYKNLVPSGSEFIATLMFEIDNEVLRHEVLSQLGGVEDTIYLRFAGQEMKAIPEDDLERTSESGKTSSVHFVHFPLSAEHVNVFRNILPHQVKIEIEHPYYAHSAGLYDELYQSLSGDLA